MNTNLSLGPSADRLLGDSGFIAAWTELHRDCPHSSIFQAPGFAATWYRVYRQNWLPVIIQARDPEGALVALWLLAYRQADQTLVHAGAHQAEYHTWLALPGRSQEFLEAAWRKLSCSVRFSRLSFKYMPGDYPPQVISECAALRNRVAFCTHQRPLLRLDRELIRVSLGKKANKSRINRLKKLGELSFRRIVSPAEARHAIRELVAFYDFRQGAISDSTPFLDDGDKERFHLELITEIAQKDLFFTETLLDEIPIALFWGLASGESVHLGMLAHSPLLAAHSPGKIHIMQLSEHLLDEAKATLDMTPGGDPWKERFANDHDRVDEAVLYRSYWRFRIEGAKGAVTSLLRRNLMRIGISPDHLRSALAALRRFRFRSIPVRLARWAHDQREFRVYRIERGSAGQCRSDAAVICNDIAGLARFIPGEQWQTRKGFLSSALDRLEEGQLSFSVRFGDRLAHSGWMIRQTESYMSEVEQSIQLPDGSAVLYDFYTHPDFRGRGLYGRTISHMLHAAFADPSIQFVYISVLADNVPSRRAIENAGFEHHCSYYWIKRLGRVNKWRGQDLPSASQRA